MNLLLEIQIENIRRKSILLVLDDDIPVPKKIQRQVECLEGSQ